METTGSRGLKGRTSEIRRVLVFRALNLGDMLCAVPALRALRGSLPHARISLCGLPWARSFVRRFSRYLDDFIEFPGYPGLPERDWSGPRVQAFVNDMKTRRFDLAVQMHGSGGISNGFIASVGARFVAGFHPGSGPGPGEFFTAYPASLPEVERNLSLVRLMGFPASDPRLEFPFLDDDADDLSASAELRVLGPRTYACIHPGASTRSKCWPVAHFAAVAAHVRRSGLTVVITGNRRESDLAQAIREMLHDEGCIDAASLDLSLGSLALLIRNARLLVCNDTGVSHIASALRVRSVVLFSTADPVRWAPLDADLHRSLGGFGTSPAVEEVLHQVQQLLSTQEYSSCQPATARSQS